MLFFSIYYIICYFSQYIICYFSQYIILYVIFLSCLDKRKQQFEVRTRQKQNLHRTDLRFVLNLVEKTNNIVINNNLANIIFSSVDLIKPFATGYTPLCGRKYEHVNPSLREMFRSKHNAEHITNPCSLFGEHI